jgi:hypothetical protein
MVSLNSSLLQSSRGDSNVTFLLLSSSMLKQNRCSGLASIAVPNRQRAQQLHIGTVDYQKRFAQHLYQIEIVHSNLGFLRHHH